MNESVRERNTYKEGERLREMGGGKERDRRKTKI